MYRSGYNDANLAWKFLALLMDQLHFNCTTFAAKCVGWLMLMVIFGGIQFVP